MQRSRSAKCHFAIDFEIARPVVVVAGVTVVSGVVLAVVAVDSVTDVWVCEVAGVVLLTLPLVNDVDVALLSVNGVVVASVPTRRIRWREIFLYN